MTMSRAAEWFWVLLALLVLNLTYATTQPLNNFHHNNVHEEQGADGQIYHAMARNMPRELPPQGMAPFVYRIGTPLLAAGLAKSLDWPISAGFDRLNVAFNTLSVILLLLLLQRHVASVTARLLVIVAFMVEPHSPVRFSYFHPLSVDPAVLAGLLAGLLSIEWFQSRPIPRRAALVALLVAVGVAFHEVMLIVGACVLVGPLSGTAAGGEPRPSGWRDRLAALDRTGAWLPLISGAAALLAIHAWVAASPSGHSASTEALRWLREKSLLHYGMAWWLVFGPLLAVPIFFWRRSISVLRERPVWLVYLSVFAVLAWLGGSETERLLVFASPVVYVLIARALTWAGVGATSVAMASLVLAQALSSRVFAPIGGPIQPPEVKTEIWERLGWAETAWALSYENMWSQLCAPSMMRFYLLWYGLMGGGVLGVLWYQSGGNAKVDVLWNTARNRTNHSKIRLVAFLSATASRSPAVWTILGTAAALSPVVWLALSRFYWNNYAQPGSGYLLYNLARLWTLIVVLAAFWATGSRLIGYVATRADTSKHRTTRFIDAAFCGAAAWSVGVVLLAMIHLYYVWVILPLLAVAVALAIYDLAATRGETYPASVGAPAVGRWGLVGLLLRVVVVFNAAALLLTIALWGNFGGDNDVPGNYLPYYEAVLRAHSNGPNDQWVHFFVSKGHGLAFLLNILSDAQGAALATWLVVLLGGGLIWRLAARSASIAPAIGLVGVCLYLQFYAEQGAYAKGHIIRNIFILYLILSFTHLSCFQQRGARLDPLGRALVIAAVILLSPLAIVLLLPILLVETVLIALSQGTVAAKHSLFYPGWAIAATALVCLYNFLAVGLPELHAMPSFVGQVVDIERLSRWIDPQLAYIDYHLTFMRVALSGSDPAIDPLVTMSPTLSLAQVLPGLLNPATMAWVGGSAIIGILGLALPRGPARPSGTPGYGAAAAAAYLLAILAMLAGLRMFGGGPGSSMGRFTDFATPLGIALGVVLLTATWARAIGRISRGILAIAVACVACAAIYLGAPPVLSQHWRSSAGFLLGQQSYAAMNETFWDTVTAHRMAGLVRGNEKVELLNFLPGFTAIPATPFQRPDGAAYIKDYTKVLYGSEEQAAGIYAGSNINYFLFDVSGASRVVWSGFSALFTPESIRSRMRLVTHDVSERRDLYLLTWNRTNAPAGGEAFETFLQKWSDKLASEKRNGYYHVEYEHAARRMGQR